MSSNSVSKLSSNQMMALGLAAAAAASIALYVLTTSATQKDGESKAKSARIKTLRSDPPKGDRAIPGSGSGQSSPSSTTVPASVAARAEEKNKELSEQPDSKTIHTKIEELDKKGKELFKNKQYMEAAKAFTEALEYIEANTDHSDNNASTMLNRQIMTLTNNRSAMYEKAGFPELALEDCEKVLEVYDRKHLKARQRKLRLHEETKQYYNALVEVCALQLVYMEANRTNFRMGLPPSGQPPVSQTKMEEIITLLMPELMGPLEAQLEEKKKETGVLPSEYTITQLLKSYTGYNSWMALAAKEGSVDALTQQIESIVKEGRDSPNAIADQASLLMKKGRRYAYEQKFADARSAILEGYSLVQNKPDIFNLMQNDDYARLIEWVGMVKHWSYDLTGAIKCYKECAEIEPLNTEVLVKQAGVEMDSGKHDAAVALFEKALSIDPNAADVLLHRANLRMLQQDIVNAQSDLERCIKLRPNHTIAQLRLAAVYSAKNETKKAEKTLDAAERIDPDNSEIQSYRGELLFTQNKFAEAKEHFEKAMKLNPNNPTPYVNAALAQLNTPPDHPGQQVELAKEACALFEKAIEADPFFHAAYAQLGQLKLGTASDLDSAREVIAIYDKGIEYCRTKEELKEIQSMRTLTQAQVDAATSLKMQTFNMQ